MHIRIKFDKTQIEKWKQKQLKNFAYSTAQALNDTAKELRFRVQGDLKQKFHLRRKEGTSRGWTNQSEYSDATGDQPDRSERHWLVKQIAVMTWADARQGRYHVVIGIRSRPRLLLSKFFTGGQRVGFVGKNVAVPLTKAARVTGIGTGGNIDNPVFHPLTFKELKFRKHTTKVQRQAPSIKMSVTTRSGRRYTRNVQIKVGGGKVQLKGRARTFILKKTDNHPLGGVYMRVGPRRGDIRMVYSFSRAFRIQKMFDLLSRGREVYAKEFQKNFTARFLHLKR